MTHLKKLFIIILFAALASLREIFRVSLVALPRYFYTG
jgi:hypothetical protein